MFGHMDADKFLSECITNGTATVNAVELRNLLQEKRRLERENKQLKEKMELLQLRNIGLKQELASEKINKLIVTGIDKSSLDIKA